MLQLKVGVDMGVMAMEVLWVVVEIGFYGRSTIVG